MAGTNAAAPLVYEYNARTILAKLGFRFNGDELDLLTGEAMTLIGSEFNKLSNEDLDKKSPKGKAPRRPRRR